MSWWDMRKFLEVSTCQCPVFLHPFSRSLDVNQAANQKFIVVCLENSMHALAGGGNSAKSFQNGSTSATNALMRHWERPAGLQRWAKGSQVQGNVFKRLPRPSPSCQVCVRNHWPFTFTPHSGLEDRPPPPAASQRGHDIRNPLSALELEF